MIWSSANRNVNQRSSWSGSILLPLCPHPHVAILFNLDVELIDDEEPVEEETAEPLRRELRSLEQPDVAATASNGHQDHRPHITAKGLDQSRTPQHLSYSAPAENESALSVPAAFGGDEQDQAPGRPSTTVTNADDEFADVGRNALCPCGSGKKYKRCHGAPGGPTGLTARING